MWLVRGGFSQGGRTSVWQDSGFIAGIPSHTTGGGVQEVKVWKEMLEAYIKSYKLVCLRGPDEVGPQRGSLGPAASVQPATAVWVPHQASGSRPVLCCSAGLEGKKDWTWSGAGQRHARNCQELAFPCHCIWLWKDCRKITASALLCLPILLESPPCANFKLESYRRGGTGKHSSHINQVDQQNKTEQNKKAAHM